MIKVRFRMKLYAHDSQGVQYVTEGQRWTLWNPRKEFERIYAEYIEKVELLNKISTRYQHTDASR